MKQRLNGYKPQKQVYIVFNNNSKYVLDLEKSLSEKGKEIEMLQEKISLISLQQIQRDEEAQLLKKQLETENEGILLRLDFCTCKPTSDM